MTAFARTMRCASVAGVTRNARAISSVVRPQTSRKVSATCPSGGRAGWQQVKMRRRRSSSISSSAWDASLTRASRGSARSLCAASKRPLAHRVNGLETRSRYEPGAGVFRYAGLGPGVQGGSKSLMHGLFGKVEIAEQVHQSRQNPARFGSIKSLYGLAQVFGHTLRHPRHTSRETESPQLRVASSIHNSVMG